MKRRIVILLTGLNFGGAEKQALIVAGGLRDRGWDVKIISLLRPPSSDHRNHAAGVPVESLQMTGSLSAFPALLRLVRLLRADKPHVLLTFMFHANILGRIAGRIASVPVVSSIRAEHFGGKARDYAERLTGSLAQATVVNSVRVGEALVRRGVISRKRLRFVPNGVAGADSEPPALVHLRTIRATLGIAEGDFLWLAVGRLEEPKDYTNLFHALHILRRTHPHAQLRIAGGGYQLELLTKLRDDLQLGAAAQLLGFRADVVMLLEAADALVLSSAWESSPNVVLEAMAAGKFVVATNVGGVADLVEPGRTGLLVPPRDAAALAAAMQVAMTYSESERQHMGALGRSKVMAIHGEERVCDNWDDLLAQAAGERTRSMRSNG